MKVDVFDKQNNKVGTIDLPDGIFAVKWNPNLVHQALMAQLSNSRQNLAHAKGRGEVRGGGKKPWKQKGTGRARHGSIRSPLWRGGGATFGPTKEENFKRKINKKMRRLAVLSVLSRKFKENELKVVDNFETGDLKTKGFFGSKEANLNNKKFHRYYHKDQFFNLVIKNKLETPVEALIH
ncbi:50S ribosomal protein L4, partial [Candidatus Wolfebacteria bacterium]|nr:50S ribosomal protein L4 [Candidatus Wolfebacteria bacterium]